MRKQAFRGGLVAVLLGSGIPAAYGQETQTSVRTAHREGRLELDAMLGAHIFADDLELGVMDVPEEASSPDTFGLAGIRLGFRLNDWFGLEGELVAIPTSDRFEGDTVVVFGARAHLLVHLTRGRVRPFLVAGAGGLMVSGDGDGMSTIGDDTDFAPHWGAGVRIGLGRGLSFRLDARHILPPDTDDGGLTNDFEVSAGLAMVFGGDRDKTVTIRDTVVTAPPSDIDHDTILDDDDKCPAEAEDLDGDADEDGCPDLDMDGDGLPDGKDPCPGEAEVLNGIDDDDGCPETDFDNDGLFGSTDKCPEQAEDRDNFTDDDGCPDPDNDGDGVADAQDTCPTELETKNGYKDNDGCPDELPKQVKKFTGVMEGITFQQNSAEIKKSSFKLLDRAAKLLEEYPDLRIEVAGHTSDEGERDHNVELSKQRAEAVKAYLVSKGIAEDRITTVGYGPDKPIADNKKKKGRERNRRIEFRLISE